MASGRLADLSLLLTLVAAAAAGAQDLPRGQVVPDVKCLADASQSYALYLPSTYSPDKAWPLLMGFHPGARGIAIVEKYRAPLKNTATSSPPPTIPETDRGTSLNGPSAP
jgi:poly(3-hydroxybutyrate) depolymerase